MIPRYTPEELNNAGYFDKLPCECEECHQIFYQSKPIILNILRHSKFHNQGRFCSRKCFCVNRTKLNRKTIFCAICNKPLFLKKSQIKPHNFCSKKCQYEYHKGRHLHTFICFWCGNTFENKYKKTKQEHRFCSTSCAVRYKHSVNHKGDTRSKLELWLEGKLNETYPTLEIHYNRKDAINAELDIYIPSLQLAFELNGIFHYEPIFGVDKLTRTQNNDNRKYQACLERNIELCTIDTTPMPRFKPDKAHQFLNIIKSIIDLKL